MAELSFIRRGEEVMHYHLKQKTTRIGRDSGNDIAFPEKERQISRFHALLEARGSLYWLRDLTGQGLRVNDQLIFENLLQDGDHFLLGSWEVLFRQHSHYQNHESTLVTSHSETLPMGQENDLLNQPMAQLIYSQKGNKQKLFLGKEAIQIGSSEDATICLEEDYISSFHCRIFWNKGSYHIRDLESLNGVWVNGMKVREAELPDKAQIYVGKFPIEFSYVSQSASSQKASLQISQSQDLGYPNFMGMVSNDAAMQRLFTLIQRVADNDMPVLINGESGTGKELVAKAIHALSSRKNEPFVAMNSGATSKELMGSTLFGHEKGAFTGAFEKRVGVFEEAGKGSLFLDEIGDMPLDQQVALLRVLEGGGFRKIGGTKELQSYARVITATHRNIPLEIQEGRFREDLFYRIAVLNLTIPPLRERKADILLLARYFLQYFAGHRSLSFSDASLNKLLEHQWPGNVRELRNTIQRAIVLVDSDTIQPNDIILQSVEFNKVLPPKSSSSMTVDTFPPSQPPSLEDTEKQALLKEKLIY